MSTPSLGSPRESHRILIVEDDYVIALQFEHVLTEAGYDVIDIASTAEEAIQIAVEDRPELVLMDVRLAGPLDGIDAATQIHQRLGIPSIFISAVTDPATKARAERAGPAAWLPKPVPDEKLIATLRVALHDE